MMADTQERAAHAIGVTVQTLNRWETGHRQPSPLSIRAIKLYIEIS